MPDTSPDEARRLADVHDLVSKQDEDAGLVHSATYRRRTATALRSLAGQVERLEAGQRAKRAAVIIDQGKRLSRLEWLLRQAAPYTAMTSAGWSLHQEITTVLSEVSADAV